LTEPKGARTGFGFFVMTPLQTADGAIVYVNRGFVPRDSSRRTRGGRANRRRDDGRGALRAPIDRAWFMPGDDAARNEWFSRDPKLYAAASGLPVDRVAPYFIDARFDPALPGGLPQAARDHHRLSQQPSRLRADLVRIGGRARRRFAAYACGNSSPSPGA
jgi:surfeit locus 1 family protein